jgi:hypothetical protein
MNILPLNILATSNNIPSMLCDHDAPLNVEFQPTGGVFTSTSVTGSTFNPASASPGWHYFQYQLNIAGSCPVNVTDSLELLPSSQYVLDTTVSDTLILNGQVYTQSGQYQQQLLAANGCDSLLSIYLTVDPVGVYELLENAFKLWPNPNNGNFQLEVPDKNRYFVRCLDNLGREIQAFQIVGQQSYQINQFSFLAPGCYHLLLTSKDSTIKLSLIIE